MQHRYLSSVLAALILAAACTGNIDGDGAGTPAPSGTPAAPARQPTGGGGQQPPSISPGPDDRPGASAGVIPLRRLSRAEYRNTVADLLGVELRPEEEFVSDAAGPAGYLEGSSMSDTELERMAETVGKVVQRYRTARLTAELGCDPARSGEEPCATTFLRAFAARAYRHPPSDAEIADLVALYRHARAVLAEDFLAAVATAVEGALLSPRFHYRWELGDAPATTEGGLIVLNDHEVASRLSYFLWQTMPDAALFDSARKGELRDPRAVAAHVKRMLADPRGRRGVRGFFQEWLPMEKLDGQSAGAPHASMKESALMFFEDLVIGAGDRRFATLVAGDYAFVDGPLAGILGMSGTTGTALRKVKVTDPRRAGVLTHPAFLAATAGTTLATVIHRGRFVYERIGECASVPDVPGDIPDPPPRREGASVREHLSAHAQDPGCRACHQFMDPIGFAFDGFDELGRARDADGYGKPLDTRGEMPISDGALAFTDAADLARKLAARPGPMRCFARQVTRYALRASTLGDSQASVDAAAAGFAASGGDIAALLAGVAQTPSFFRRKPAEGEVLK